MVSAVCEVPGGAFPSYAQGYYARDNAFYKAWDAIARDRESFTGWIERHVIGDRGLRGVPAQLAAADGEHDRRPMAEPQYTADEMMTVAAARMLRDGAVCFVGIGLPSAAANLARLTHAPDTVLIYESGTIGTKPTCCRFRSATASLPKPPIPWFRSPEIFAYWLQGGRIDVGFLGAAQIDRFANINTTVIGDYRTPKMRLPGAGGAPEIAGSCGEVLIMLRQSKRAFVEKLDFVTSGGHLDGGDSRANDSACPASGPTAVITDLGIITPDPTTKELTLTSLHPGVTVEQAIAATGWPLKVAANLAHTAAPSAAELAALRDLNERTARARAAGA